MTKTAFSFLEINILFSNDSTLMQIMNGVVLVLTQISLKMKFHLPRAFTTNTHPDPTRSNPTYIPELGDFVLGFSDEGSNPQNDVRPYDMHRSEPTRNQSSVEWDHHFIKCSRIASARKIRQTINCLIATLPKLTKS